MQQLQIQLDSVPAMLKSSFRLIAILVCASLALALLATVMFISLPLLLLRVLLTRYGCSWPLVRATLEPRWRLVRRKVRQMF